MDSILAKAVEMAASYRITARAHYLEADHYAKLNRLFGVPVVVITAVVGTTIFSTIEQNPSVLLKILAGLTSLAGTVLATLQTTLAFAQTAEKHKSAGEAYRSVQRRFEMFELKFKNASTDKRDTALSQLEDLVDKLEEIAASLPAVSDSFYNAAKKRDAKKRELCSPQR